MGQSLSKGGGQMAKNNQKQYIHYGSSGFVYHFFLVGMNLYVRVLKESIEYNSMKLEEKVLEFSMAIDHAGKFHVASILENGHLKYGIYLNESWESRSLMTFDRNHNRLKNITLFVFEEKIHILMAQAYTESNELWTLKHYYWNKQSWENQKICEIITSPYDVPFYADIDGKNTIHLVYKSRVGKFHQIYYEKFLLPYGSWCMPVKISEEPFDHTNPFILCDEKNILHIAWSTLANGHYQINYFESKYPLSYKNNMRKEIKTISKKGTDCTYPYLMQLGQYLIILWKEGNHFFIQKKVEHQEHWTEAQRFTPSSEKPLMKISILGTTYKGSTPIRIPAAYGYMDAETTVFGVDPSVPHMSKEEIVKGIDDNDSCIPSEVVEYTEPPFPMDDHEYVEPNEAYDVPPLLLEKLEEITLENLLLRRDLQFFIEAHQASLTRIHTQLEIIQKQIENMGSSKKGFFQKLQSFLQKNDPS